MIVTPVVVVVVVVTTGNILVAVEPDALVLVMSRL